MTNPLFSILVVLGFADPTVPDRCAELGTDGYPALCDPIGEHIAPAWHDLVCCDASTCTPFGPRGCGKSTLPYFCEYAELDASNQVTCLFTVPQYCDVFPCPPAADPEYQAPAQAQPICCYEEGCYAVDGDPCGGIIYWCDDGSTNEDGTVTCHDED
jgi:hypothetical protein